MFDRYQKCVTEKDVMLAAEDYLNEEDTEKSAKQKLIDDFFNKSSSEDEYES